MKKQVFSHPTAKVALLYRKVCFIAAFLIITCLVQAQSFVHPGLLHTQTDLDRMKDRVAQGAHPWIDGWNLLLQDPKAQSNYNGRARANMNLRQVMSEDAIAAYLNAIRWYISGDNSYAQCAIGILNNYSNTVDQIPSGGNTDTDGLGGIGVAMMCNAAEIMKLYSGWNASDITNFKDMMVDYFYPLRHEFLTNHRGSCIDNYWANWDANNITALFAIGVVADNQAIYDEGYDYYLNGAGTGSIKHAVYYVHPGGLGQWQESGRDQEHAQLGVGLLAAACQIAWNQGQDLFGYDNNRLLAGAEYTAKYNQMQDVPFETYNNCQPANHDWPAINGRGRLDDRPIWELIYNHYVVRQGLSAPYTQRMAELMRPEHGSRDHLGYGTLTFTLEPSTYPPHPVPAAPSGLTATAGTGQVILTWQPPGDLTANGYVVQRSTSSGGGFTTIDSWDDNTRTRYIDKNVSDGTTYYYRVAAVNQSGSGAYSAASSARPLATGPLPTGWNRAEIGSQNAGDATYADVSGGTFVVNSYGTDVDGTIDNATFVYKATIGDGAITGRINNISGTLARTGLMIRETLDANSKAVVMTLGEGGWRFARMGYRTSTGANTSSTLGNTYTWQPAWFRIARSGDTFTAYESSDGETWFEVASVSISMSSSYFIGLVACSGNATAVNTTVYDNVTVTGSIVQIKNRATGLYLDGMGLTTNGSACGQWANTTSTNAQWNIQEFNDNYRIRNVSTDLYLDGMGRTSNGSACGQWANTTSTNAQWRIEQFDGNYYRIRNVSTGLYLDGMGRTSNGADCGQWANTTSSNAQWELIPVSSSASISSSTVKTTIEKTVIEPIEIEVYPNPVSNKLTIQLSDNYAEKTEIILHDNLGQLVMRRKVSGKEYILDVSAIPQGIYVLTLTNREGSISRMVVKK